MHFKKKKKKKNTHIFLFVSFAGLLSKNYKVESHAALR